MKRFYLLVVLSGLITTFLPMLAAADDQAFTLCYEDQHFPPFLLGTDVVQTDKPAGILVDYVKLAAQNQGMVINFVRLPWKRCQQAVHTGEVDGLFVFIYSEERDAWAQFPKTNGQPDDRYTHLSTYKVFVRNGSNLTWNGETFSPTNATIQSVPGYMSDKKLQNMGYVPVANLQPKEALPLVESNRLDGYILDDLIGKSLLINLGLSESLSTLNRSFMTDPWYVVFSKQRYAKSAVEIERFWDTLRVIRIEESERIISSYLSGE